MTSRPLILLLVILGTIAVPSARSSAAASAAKKPLHAVVQRGGLRLELTVPRASYPRDALVRVWASVRNTTHRTLWIESNGPQAPGRYLPQVEVLDRAGHSLPLSLTTYFPYPGPPPGPVSIAPGAAIAGPEDLVLRGARVRLSVLALSPRDPRFGPHTRLETPALHLHLRPVDSPTVQLITSGSPSATIVRPTGLHGLPLAVWYADCGGVNYSQEIYWTKVSLHLTPGCSPLQAWHVLVGWRGHSVASIDYPGG